MMLTAMLALVYVIVLGTALSAGLWVMLYTWRMERRYKQGRALRSDYLDNESLYQYRQR